jgi:hypothetical protein
MRAHWSVGGICHGALRVRVDVANSVHDNVSQCFSGTSCRTGTYSHKRGLRMRVQSQPRWELILGSTLLQGGVVILRLQ